MSMMHRQRRQAATDFLDQAAGRRFMIFAADVEPGGIAPAAPGRIPPASRVAPARQPSRDAVGSRILEAVARGRRMDSPVAPAMGHSAAAVDQAFRELSASAGERGFVEAVIVGRASALQFLRYDDGKLMRVVEHKGRVEPRDRCTWRAATPVLTRGYLDAIARGDVLIEIFDRALGTFCEVHRATGKPIPKA
jgi:hypothetical protein